MRAITDCLGIDVAVRVFNCEAVSGVGGLDFFDSIAMAGDVRLSETTVEKWWCLGDARNRAGMWVQGRSLPIA